LEKYEESKRAKLKEEKHFFPKLFCFSSSQAELPKGQKEQQNYSAGRVIIFGA
jgi:hypothetical protein